MRTSKSKRYDTSSRVHIIVLYILIGCLTIVSAVYFVCHSRLIRAQILELNLLKQRIEDVENAQIIISSSDDDGLPRQSRHAKLKAKLFNKEYNADDHEALVGSIHFRVPVGEIEK